MSATVVARQKGFPAKTITSFHYEFFRFKHYSNIKSI
ncbi:hypothetical protein CCACVL1_10446 [Corchorus capsularis]|uniref:Uncharacterized protein n=1 Tax=Corchorus capsularis TaxID=210143 RepID=A0A1R3IRB3_COCAP|nr:hypothetical protein CCACVL1_10446 [Corchorus capsularis]